MARAIKLFQAFCLVHNFLLDRRVAPCSLTVPVWDDAGGCYRNESRAQVPSSLWDVAYSRSDAGDPSMSTTACRDCVVFDPACRPCVKAARVPCSGCAAFDPKCRPCAAGNQEKIARMYNGALRTRLADYLEALGMVRPETHSARSMAF